MAWRHYRILTNGATFQVPAGVRVVGLAALGPGGRCVHEQGGLGGGGGGGFAYGLRRVDAGERLTGFVVDGAGSRFGEVLNAEAGGESVDVHGGAGGIGHVVFSDRSVALHWLGLSVVSGGRGGVGQRSGPWVTYGGGGGAGSFYGQGGAGGDGRLVGVASMFGHGGGGGLGGDGGDSLADRAIQFIDRQAIKEAGNPEDWVDFEHSSGPGGGGGGGLSAGGDAWGDYGYLMPKRRAESLGGPGGGGGSFGPGDMGGVLYQPVIDEVQMGRLLATETPGKGGVGLRALGGVSRFHPGHYLSAHVPDDVKPEKDVSDESASPAVYFSTGSGEGRTGLSPYLALAAQTLDGGGGAGANLCGAGHGGPGSGGGGAGRLPGFDQRQGRGGLAGHGGFGGGGGGGATRYHAREAVKPGGVDCLPAGDGGVGGGGGGGGYGDSEGRIVLPGAGEGGPGGGGGGGPGSQGGAGFFIVYW